MAFIQEFSPTDTFPKFVQGIYLKTLLTRLPSLAENKVYIMVPYLIESDILQAILRIPFTIEVKILTRSKKGYLPTIKGGVDEALAQLKKRNNISVYIDNRIHAKIWLIDEKFAVVHSMNGTPYSENINLEAGIVSDDPSMIREIYQFFAYAEKESKILSK